MPPEEPFHSRNRPDMTDMPELQCIGIFAHAATVTLTRLAMACHHSEFAAGEMIMSRGESDTSVMLLLRGQVRVTIYSPEGREVAIRRIDAGDVFGDYAAIDQKPRSADVVAVTNVDVARLPAAEFAHLVAADPAVARAQMRELVGMIRHLSQRIYELTTLKASQRLVSRLLDLADDAHANQAVIPELPTHAELAALISSQRHVVTSELGRLQEDGLVNKQGKTLLLLDLAALRALQGEP